MSILITVPTKEELNVLCDELEALTNCEAIASTDSNKSGISYLLYYGIDTSNVEFVKAAMQNGAVGVTQL